MAPHGALGQEARPGARTERRPPFLGPGARSLIALKLVRLHLPPEMSKISPHPWASCLWKPSSFSDRGARAEEAESIGKKEKVWTEETMAVIGWKMTLSKQAETGVEEEEVWIVASPVRPSSVGP